MKNSTLIQNDYATDLFTLINGTCKTTHGAYDGAGYDTYTYKGNSVIVRSYESWSDKVEYLAEKAGYKAVWTGSDYRIESK